MSFPVLKAAVAMAALISALPAAAADTSEASWAATVRDQLAKAQEYPSQARAQGLEGTVMLRMDVARDGLVTGYEIVESSGRLVLDRAVLRAARKIDRLPALVDGAESYSFIVPMSFKLADAADVARDAATQDAWQDLVRRRVADSLAYSNKMTEAGLEGQVKLRLTLAADGHVIGRGIHQSSGNKQLDAEVLHLAGRIERLPGVPAGEEGASLVLPLNYKLADAR